MKLNFEYYKDKVNACWIGKNIGGTMGTPYEGTREMLDIQGFVTKPGEVLPNDLYFAIREVREGTTFTFTFTAEDGTTTTRSFSNPAGYANRKFKKVLSLGTITLDDWV